MARDRGGHDLTLAGGSQKDVKTRVKRLGDGDLWGGEAVCDRAGPAWPIRPGRRRLSVGGGPGWAGQATNINGSVGLLCQIPIRAEVDLVPVSSATPVGITGDRRKPSAWLV